MTSPDTGHHDTKQYNNRAMEKKDAIHQKMLIKMFIRIIYFNKNGANKRWWYNVSIVSNILYLIDSFCARRRNYEHE